MSSDLTPLQEVPVHIEPDLTPNAPAVLEDRYLMRQDDGRVAETPAELFGRVAKAVAAVESTWGASSDEVHRIEGQFYRSFGGDHVQNLSRVLRLPGTLNYEDARNGRPPQPCVLCQCDGRLRDSLETFSPWFDPAVEKQQRPKVSALATPPAGFSADEIFSGHAEAALLVSRLQEPSPDRSRRDFAVVCDLIRLGLTQEEIWSLVAGTSKFATAGRPYFDLTIANARHRLSLGEPGRGRRRASG